MHGIGIVPENFKIRLGGFHRRQTAHHCIGIGVAVGVGIFRHTPNALYRRVLHKALHQVHIRAILMHRNQQKLHAEIFRDAEMAVITGCRAQEFACTFSPALAFAKTFAHGELCHMIHHSQAGAAAHQRFFRCCAQQISKKAACFRHAFQGAVVAGVNAFFTHIITNLQHGHGKLQLFGTRLAARHIEAQPFLYKRFILCAQCLMFLFQLLAIHRNTIRHLLHPLLCAACAACPVRFRALIIMTAKKRPPAHFADVRFLFHSFFHQ